MREIALQNQAGLVDASNYPKKNYIGAKKFGQDRSYVPPFEDPHPVKYGGKYGLQNLKDQIDT